VELSTGGGSELLDESFRQARVVAAAGIALLPEQNRGKEEKGRVVMGRGECSGSTLGQQLNGGCKSWCRAQEC